MAASATDTRWHVQRRDRVVARRRRSIVVLDIPEVWAFEAKNRLCFVHSFRGRFDVDVSLLELEAALGKAFLRVHRCWLANVANVRELGLSKRVHFLVVGSRVAGEVREMRVPVSRELAGRVKETLLAGTVGFHRRTHVIPLGKNPIERKPPRSQVAE
jgi:DNA-binding LytR/AlgR family response regulator